MSHERIYRIQNRNRWRKYPERLQFKKHKFLFLSSSLFIEDCLSLRVEYILFDRFRGTF